MADISRDNNNLVLEYRGRETLRLSPMNRCGDTVAEFVAYDPSYCDHPTEVTVFVKATQLRALRNLIDDILEGSN